MLCVGGHDPSGGAGIVADVQTATALGVHPLTVISALTVQDSRNAVRVRSVPAPLFFTALTHVTADIKPRIVKVGLLGSEPLVHQFTRWRNICAPRLPVIIDPILWASGGKHLWTGRGDPVEALKALLPGSFLVTPNRVELRALTPDVTSDDDEARARRLCELGVMNVLVTGGDLPGYEVRSALYDHRGCLQQWGHPRLPGSFHGSGCTLATAIGACLALGHDLRSAIGEAERFTASALASAQPLGHGAAIPWRVGRWS